MIKIAHIADTQVKCPDNSQLFRVYGTTFNNIIDTIKIHNDIQAVVVAGDLFEYATPSDSERRLVYKFIADLCNIPTVKEVVIMPGNHDLQKSNKTDVSNIVDHNALNIFADLINYLIPDAVNKLIYINKTSVYKSKLMSDSLSIKWVGYSLEDGMTFDDNSVLVSPDDINNSQIKHICIYHAMLREYVDGAKLPIRKDIYNKLDDMSMFPPHSLILAGDIHEQHHYQTSDGKDFIYPGSTQQHTHNEGSYITVSTKGSTLTKHAESKYIYTYELYDRDSFTIDKIPIVNNVTYTTINIQDVPNEPLAIDTMLDHITEYIPQTSNGIILNNITVKLPSTLSSVSQHIFNKLKSVDTSNTFNISLSYDKLVSKLTNNNSEVVESVINSVISEQSECSISTDSTITTDNIDKLVLTDDKILKLFMYVADSQIKSVIKSNDELPYGDYEKKLSDDLGALFMSELNKAMDGQKRYDICLNSVECNQFMSLGHNVIDLSDGNLIRIYGTNGVGKTTLYRLIRWLLTGVPFAGMKSSTAVKNAMTIFNIYDVNNDIVDAKLKCTINGNNVLIHRTAVRKWKNSTTYEHKTSINWRDYVSTIDRSITITVNPESENAKSITGDNAEKTLVLWIGDIHRLMFVDSFNIENLLKGDVSNVNEHILSAIGVDYIKMLESNLDQVKSELNTVAKPTMPKLDMLVHIDRMKKTLEEADQLIEQYQSTINSLTQLSEEKVTKIKQINNSLINMGNIPMLISDLETVISSLTEKVTNFKPEAEKDLIKIDLVAPSAPKEDIINCENIISNYKDDLVKNETKIDYLKKERHKIYEDVKHVYDQQQSSIDDVIKEYESERNNNVEKLGVITNDIVTECEKIIAKANNDKLDILNKISELRSNISVISAKIKENLDIIENGVCKTCNRPFADDFDLHKQELLLNNDKLNKAKNEYQNLVDKELESIINYDKVIKQFENIKRTSYENMVGRKENLQVIEGDLQRYIELYNQTIVGYHRFTDDIVQEQKKKTNLSNELDVITNSVMSFNHIDTSNLIDDVQTDVGNINENLRQLLDCANIVTNINNRIIEKQQHISDLNNKYQYEVSEYNKKLADIQHQNDSIEKYNKSVREHNQQNELDIKELTYKQSDLISLKDKLPEFNTIKELLYVHEEELESIKDDIERTNQSHKDVIASKVNAGNQIDNYQKMYDNALLYEHNQLIWKIYSKIVKNNFKDVVFEYYRGFLNNTLADLLDDINFKLFWNDDSELYLMLLVNNEGTTDISYIPVAQASGMQSIFAGLSLIYTMSILNVKNTCTHVFIDELSGALNKGDVKHTDKQMIDYQHLFVKILHKFTDKTIFVIDHNVKEMNEDVSYTVVSDRKESPVMKAYYHKN